jgi:hypothetical protein
MKKFAVLIILLFLMPTFINKQTVLIRPNLSVGYYLQRILVDFQLKKKKKEIYFAPSEDAVLAALDRFSKKWDKKYSIISRSWRNRWNEVIPFMKFSPYFRKIIYTTNTIGYLNYTLQRNLKSRLSFPSNESVMKLIFTI